MNVAMQPMHTAEKLKVTLLLQTLDSGKVSASVLEFPDCRVEADTKESAISLVNVLLSERLKNTDIIAFELPLPIDSTDESPWKKLFGLFKDDADFAEIAAAIRAEREVEDDSEVDPSVYLRKNA
jgi:hypothetical protein